MTKIQYKDYNQNDFLLFPPCIGDFVPENHPRKFDTLKSPKS